jgi:hypothetical protein
MVLPCTAQHLRCSLLTAPLRLSLAPPHPACSAFQHQYQQRKPQQQQQPPPAVCLSHEDARQLDAARRFLALF